MFGDTKVKLTISQSKKDRYSNSQKKHGQIKQGKQSYGISHGIEKMIHFDFDFWCFNATFSNISAL